MTGYQLKRQLLGHRTSGDYILLFKNQRINEHSSLNEQVPQFASIMLCALGKGGGKENRDEILGTKFTKSFFVLIKCLRR